MDKRKAQSIGSKAGLKGVTIGLVMAEIIMTLVSLDDGIFKAVFWFADYNYLLNLIFAVIILYLCGHFYGQAASKAILISHKNYNLEGFKFGIFTLFTSTVISSCISFLIEGTGKIGVKGEQPIFDYIFSPIYWVSFFGLIPAMIVGYWFGKQIRRRIKFK